MIYLTQAFLPFKDAARLKLKDSYDWHQIVWCAFKNSPNANRPFLTRLERNDRHRTFRLLILSPRIPLRPEAWPDDPESWQTKEIKPSFFAHRCYHFKLRANPTKREKSTGKRIPLLTRESQVQWLQRKGAQSGFEIAEDSLLIIPVGREWFRIEKRNLAGFHHAVEFEGKLSVSHPERFASAVIKGIGPAKAFGFGLMALVPLDSLRVPSLPTTPNEQQGES